MDSPQIKHTNWNGFDHDKVIEKFNLTSYLGDSEIDGFDGVSIYYAENPDKSKGHKHIVYLTPEWINGMDLQEFKEKYNKINGLYCVQCDEIIYSPHRHGMVWCKGKHVAIDGGRSYSKITGYPKDYIPCTIDLLKQIGVLNDACERNPNIRTYNKTFSG